MTDHSTARALVERLNRLRDYRRTIFDVDGQSTEGDDVDVALTEAANFIEQTLTPAEGDTLSDEVVKAYIAGATEVHYAWVNSLGEENAPDREADFTEAAHDYAADLQSRVSPQEGPSVGTRG